MTGTLIASTINAGASASLLLQSNSATALTLDTSQNVTAVGTVAMASSFKRNRIINGNMLIDQRNAGASVTPTFGVYTLDRWALNVSAASKVSVQQNAGSVTPPAGFVNYAGLTSTSAYTVVAGDYISFSQAIEGFNVADLGWGTASAKSATLSFWARSSLTGTFGGCVQNGGLNRSYPFSYTISSANTWEQKTVTISGDTTGTWATGNTTGLSLLFGIGVGTTYQGTAGAWAATNYVSATGSTNIVATSGATFYITGVQLEVGTKATPYEMQIYSDQLAQCQRYYEIVLAQNTGYCVGTVNFGAPVGYAVKKRTTPTQAQLQNNVNFTQLNCTATTSLYTGNDAQVLVYRGASASASTQFSELFSASAEL